MKIGHYVPDRGVSKLFEVGGWDKKVAGYYNCDSLESKNSWSSILVSMDIFKFNLKFTQI